MQERGLCCCCCLGLLPALCCGRRAEGCDVLSWGNALGVFMYQELFLFPFPFSFFSPFPLSHSLFLPSALFPLSFPLPFHSLPSLSPFPFPCLTFFPSLSYLCRCCAVPLVSYLCSDSFSSRSGSPSDHHYYRVPHHGHSCSDNNSCLKKLVRGLTVGLGWDRLPVERDFTPKLQQALAGSVWCLREDA